MAKTFYPGQDDYLDKLNSMSDAFAAGPYNALPLTGGNLTGPVSSTSTILAQTLFAGQTTPTGAASFINAPLRGATAIAIQEIARFGVGGIPGSSYDGMFSWMVRTNYSGTKPGRDGYVLSARAYDVNSAAFTPDLFSVSGAGDFMIPGNIRVGGIAEANWHQIYKSAGQTGAVCWFGRQGGSQPCVAISGSDSAGGWNAAGTVMFVGKNSSTFRSISAAGTINAGGADYAEYMLKSSTCGVVAPGQIIGIDAAGQITDQWSLAHTFAVKSTNPCMVGGDSWAQSLGQRPASPIRAQAVTAEELIDADDGAPASYRTIVAEPGDTDAEWDAREAEHAAALAAFDSALEALRQTVDRIAFAGQVPVNVLGAAPGQYIVPAQDGAGITGIAVDEDALTLQQYMRSVGKAIAVEDDGRARIIVKVA